MQADLLDICGGGEWCTLGCEQRRYGHAREHYGFCGVQCRGCNGIDSVNSEAIAAVGWVCIRAGRQPQLRARLPPKHSLPCMNAQQRYRSPKMSLVADGFSQKLAAVRDRSSEDDMLVRR